jgi:hypothetical protein
VPTPLRTRAAAIVTTRIFLNSALPVSGPIWPHRPELPPGSPRQISRATSASVSPNRGEIGGRGATGFALIADERCRRLPAADLPRGHLGEYEVVVLERPPENRSRMALRGRRCSSRGPRRRSECRARAPVAGRQPPPVCELAAGLLRFRKHSD